jgi:hypothetical protein
MLTEDELIEIIAEELYECRNHGVWKNASESDKDPYYIEAGFVSDGILREWEKRNV